jgi:hypothetical protein
MHAACDASGVARLITLPLRADGGGDASAASELLKGDFT